MDSDSETAAGKRNLPDLSSFRSLGFSVGGHPVTRILCQPAAAVLAWVAVRCRLTANQVTSIGAALSVAGAAAYATLEPGLPGTLISLVLLQIGYIMDCADGQVARATRSASRFGGWWDIYCDFLAQFALGLAVLYRLIAPANHMNPWALACVLLFLFGRISSVYSSTVARSWGIHQAVRPSGNGDKVRTFVVSLLDTPVLLLLICLMRDSTSLLTAYLALMGLLYSFHGALVGYSAARRADEMG